MSTYTAADFAKATFARHPSTFALAVRNNNSDRASSPWTTVPNGRGSIQSSTDAILANFGWIPVQENGITDDAIKSLIAKRERVLVAKIREVFDLSAHPSALRIAAAVYQGLTEKPRPAWLNAPAVQAWHRNDHRTEHDGTPGKPRIWSPDYGTVDTWSTPSLPSVHWSELVDVVPLAATGADVGEQS